MRALRRWFRRWRAYRQALPYLETCRPQVQRALGGPVTWRRTGGRGRDVVCLALRAGRPAGVLRVTSPDAPGSTPLSAGMPFVSLPPEEKLAREWHAYATGHPLGLTPRPLWRDSRAMLCAYADAAPLAQAVSASGASTLALATDALPHIARLHAAGLAHMDMSLANILRERTGETCLFVDFEYGPAPGLTFSQQCLYDYLRLLESAWKSLRPDERASAHALWGDEFLSTAPADVLSADLTPLRPALGRLLAAPELHDLFAALRQQSG